MSEFVLTWTSGDPDRRPLYLREHEHGWGSTEKRVEATRFSTSQAAISTWLEKHAFPEDYMKHVEAGEVRAETVYQRELCL